MAELQSWRLLFVVPSIPLPANTGGTLRTLHLLSALDKQFDVTVLAPHRAGTDAPALRKMLRGRVVEIPPAPKLERSVRRFLNAAVGQPVGYEQYAGPAMQRALCKLLDEAPFSLVHFDHLHTAQLLPWVRRHGKGARAVIDAHNVEAQVVERMADISTFPMRWALKWQASRVRNLESRLVSLADAVLACSVRDKSLLRWAGAEHVQVIPNGVSLEEMAQRPADERRNVIFVGSMDWWPNSDAALLLAKDIWPRCEAQLSDSRLVLAGRNPPAELSALASDRVVVTGTVDSVAPYLRESWASAIPLRAGSGTRLKILEAAAARVPVVASRLAAEGLPFLHEKHILYAESAEEFAQALVRLKESPALASELAENAFRIAQDFDWPKVGHSLSQFYRRWLATGAFSEAHANAGR
jgi:glycosyltransferase involved in cell wall biosynthesis